MTTLAEMPATKGDLQRLEERSATKADLATLRDELRTYYPTKADLSALENRLPRLIIGGSVAVVGAMALIQTFLG